MQQSIGGLVLLALGVAASPVAIVAVLVILLTRRAKTGSVLFAVAWSTGIAFAVVLSMALREWVPDPPPSLDLPFEGLAAGILGVVMIAVALLSRRRRLKWVTPASPPSWVRSVDNLSPLGGVVVALSNAVTSPKNLGFAVAAGLTIRNAADRPSEKVLAVVLYVVIASVTVAVPVLVYLLGGTRAEARIASWKRYVTEQAAVIVEVTVLVIGLALAVRGLSGLL